MTPLAPDNEDTFTVCVIPSDVKSAHAIKQPILNELQRCGYCEETTFAIKLALEEALINAVKHGNQGDPAKSITVRYSVTSEKAVIIVRDEGPGFEPERTPDPTTPERLPLPNGRGIMLIRSYMDEVRYRDDGREVYLMKRRISTKNNARRPS